MAGQENLTQTLEALTAHASAFLRPFLEDGVTSVTSIETVPMADGSGRWCSLIHLCDAQGDEMTVRVSSPAPAGTPAWATFWTEYLVENVTADRDEAI